MTLQAVGLEPARELANRRGLAGAVDADHQDHERPGAGGNHQGPGLRRQHFGECLAKHVARILYRRDVPAAGLLSHPANDVCRGFQADVGAEQVILEFFGGLVVEFPATIQSSAAPSRKRAGGGASVGAGTPGSRVGGASGGRRVWAVLWRCPGGSRGVVGPGFRLDIRPEQALLQAGEKARPGAGPGIGVRWHVGMLAKLCRMRRRQPSPRRSGPPGSVRIIGGRWRGRRLELVDGAELRPTPDRVRETLFNWLVPVLPGARCLDLYAGTGVLGLEALSRGAAEGWFVERDARCRGGNRGDAAALEQPGNGDPNEVPGRVLATDAKRWLGKPPPTTFDLVFLDPPYAANTLADLCTLLACGWLHRASHGFTWKRAAASRCRRCPRAGTCTVNPRPGDVRFALATIRSCDHGHRRHVPGNVRPHYQRPPRPGAPGRAALRPGGRGSGGQPQQDADVHARRAHHAWRARRLATSRTSSWTATTV